MHAASNRYINDNARHGGAAHTHTHTQTGGRQGVGLRAKGALSAAAKRLKTLLSTWHKNAVPNPQQELQESA